MSNRSEPIRSVKGTRDLLPPDTNLWQRVEAEAHRTFAAYHYGEIRTPILEETALFARGVGTETDIVMKEMYTFQDRGEESLTLRPEATASVVRAYIEHSLYNFGGVQKLYYIGPMFRRERPQKGRYRQFYQIGAEVLGSQSALVDAEILEMLVLFLERVGIREYQLLLNSVGCPACRAAYIEILRKALQDVKAQMCEDCQRRADTNPLRVLDCKVPADQPIIDKLPKIIDHLDPACRAHFDTVTSSLASRGIAYQVAPRLVRGLDYYTRTTFEITSGALGAQNAVVGGGRYDGLSELLGGPPTPGIGFSIGQDRLILAVQAAGQLKAQEPLSAYVVWMGDASLAAASKLVRELRAQGLSVEIDYDPMKIKKAMGIASKLGARFAIIVGEREIQTGRFQLKNLQTGTQEEVASSEIVSRLKEAVHLEGLGPKRTLKEKCQKVISDSLRRLLNEEEFAANGYVREIPQNLVPGIELADFYDDFLSGAGDELKVKMRAPYSSSALVANTFGRWRLDPTTLALVGTTQFRSLTFEKKCPTGLKGQSPHLDVVLEGNERVVAIESKCTEYLDPHGNNVEFSPSYQTIADHRSNSPWFAHMQELIKIEGQAPHYKWLNAAQLIKHYLGLSYETTYQGRDITLLYIYWEPTNWNDFREFREHREEATRFGEIVSGDAQVKFKHMSYLELWADWKSLSTPDWLPEHLLALQARYSLAIPE